MGFGRILVEVGRRIHRIPAEVVRSPKAARSLAEVARSPVAGRNLAEVEHRSHHNPAEVARSPSVAGHTSVLEVEAFRTRLPAGWHRRIRNGM